MQGSGAASYQIKRIGGVYSCSCPAWRNQKDTGTLRTCKHLKGLRGEDAERARLGGDDKAFYASGNASPARLRAAAPRPRRTPTSPSRSRWRRASATRRPTRRAGCSREKLDGMRCCYDGQKLWTRQGNEVYAPPSLLARLPAGVALDGELWLGRGKFQQCISIVRRQDRLESAWADVKYVVFDAPKAAGGIGARLKAAKAAVDGAAAAAAGQIVGGVAVEVLAHEVCKGRAHVNEKLAAVEAAGGEGVMLRHPTAPHRPGRTADLLKVKSTKDDEAIVVGHEAGKGRHTGRMGALQCRLRSGVAFKVGTGFSDHEREHPPAVGTVISFRYGELTDANVPRFPAYLRVRPDVDASEF